MTPTELRRKQAQDFASQLGLDGESLFQAAMAIWGNLSLTHYDTALSAAGAALAAVAATGSGPAQPDPPAAGSDIPGSPAREVVVTAPDGARHCFTVTGDDTMMVLVDGEPVIGVDQDGPGRWYGEDWQRMYPADSLTARSLAIEGITTETQWHDLETALGLDHGHLGRLKPWAADRPKILDARNYDLDAAIAWALRHGLAFEDEQCVRTDARPPR